MVIITAQDYTLIFGVIVGANKMWKLIEGWWNEYVDLIEYSYLLDEAYIELNIDQELGRGEC